MGLQKTNHGNIRTRLHKKYLSQVPTPHPPKVIRCTIQSRSETIRGNLKFAKEADGTLEISSAAIKILQQKIGSILFYGIDVYMTLLVELITLASEKSHETEATAI